MNAQLYLITPPDADARFIRILEDVLAENQVAALLIRRGRRSDGAYSALAKNLVPVAQKAGCAALLDNMPAEVKGIGADGVHITGDIGMVKLALDTLKPDSIVGAGSIFSKHDAMTRGELGVDYVFFGSLDMRGGSNHRATELAQWWAENFTVPAVCLDDQVANRERPYEFVAVCESIWDMDDPVSALRTLSEERES